MHDVFSRLRPALAACPDVSGDIKKGLRSSAVLVIIHRHKKTPHVFLTKRSSGLKSHTSEISFPGGRYADSDASLLHTALRETKEEVGMIFKPDQVAGCLKPVRTLTSNFVIVPFVTLQEKLPEPKILTYEVEKIVDIPLIETLKSIEPDAEHYHLSKGVFKFTYGGNVIWGATARILKQLHELLV